MFDCIGPSTKFANFQRTSSVDSDKMFLHLFSIGKNFFAFFARVFLQTFMNVIIVTDQNSFTRKWLFTNIAVISIKKRGQNQGDTRFGNDCISYLFFLSWTRDKWLDNRSFLENVLLHILHENLFGPSWTLIRCSLRML